MISRSIWSQRTFSSRHRQHAFTLLEAVLAVLIVISVGIGIAALYVRSDKANHGAQLHQQAVELVDSMAREIRLRGDTKGNFETRIGITCAATAKDRDNERSTIGHDVACWQEQVATQLANGSSRIELDTSVMPSVYVIEVSWSEPRTGTASYVVRVPMPINTSGTVSSARQP